MKLVKNLETILTRNSKVDNTDAVLTQMERFAKVRQKKFENIHAENMVRY